MVVWMCEGPASCASSLTRPRCSISSWCSARMGPSRSKGMSMPCFFSALSNSCSALTSGPASFCGEGGISDFRDAGITDHLSPFSGVVGYECLGAAHGFPKGNAAKLHEFALHLFIGQDIFHLCIDGVHYRGRRALGCHEHIPCGLVEIAEPGRALLAERLPVGHEGRALARGHAHAIDLALAHILLGRDQQVESDTALAANQVGHHGGGVLVDRKSTRLNSSH